MMMRMFLAASATSSLAITALDLLGIRKRVVNPPQQLGLKILGEFGSNILGGILFGAGMYLTGSCPGTVYSQVPVGAPAAEFVLPMVLGGLVGGLLFGYSEKWLKLRNPDFNKKGEPVSVDKLVATSHAATSVGFAAMCAGIVFAIDHFFPWKGEMGKIVADVSDPTDPLLGGILIGLLQFPAALTPAGALGFSSGWVYLSAKLAQLFDGNLEKNSPYMYTELNSRKAKTQVVAGLFVVLGSFASLYLGGPAQLTTAALEGSNPMSKGSAGAAWAFAGGVLLIFGSRLGGGCTSGHGLTGVGSLSIASMIDVACMFVGGMGMAMANQKLSPFY